MHVSAAVSFALDLTLSVWRMFTFNDVGFQDPIRQHEIGVASSVTQNYAASTSLDLTPIFNVKAASTGLNDTFADFDGSGRAYPAEYLPVGPSFVYNGIEFALPPFHNRTAFDTVRTDSQVIPVPAVHTSNSTFQSLHALATAVWPASGSSTYRQGTITFTFEDGSTESTGFVIGPWWSTNPFDGPITTPFHYANATLDSGHTIDYNVTSIGYISLRVPNEKALRSVTLPTSDTYINFFAISLLPASPLPRSTGSPLIHLSVQNVRSTTKWMDVSAARGVAANEKVQQIEITLNNLAPLDAPMSSWITRKHNFSVSLVSDALYTVVPGNVVRLRSNDQVVVRIGVQNLPHAKPGTNATANVVWQLASGTATDLIIDGLSGWEVVAGIPEWTSDDTSLRTHEAPDWFDEAKFGIFIHWGVYSVPAWAPTGQQYAEWYDWDLHNPANAGSPTWVHHLELYGPDVVYDDFIANWTAANWNPDNWTDLFHDAGAKYFVLVTKHHDGFALFDTGNSTHRNAVLLGPKRNILQDLFESAKTRHPELHRGTYFTIPEWFNPAWGPYGEQSFPGMPALNAFNGSCCDPFTGYIPVDNYLTDVQKPQMETLFYDFDTDILWCDIGGASIFPKIGATWYNYAASKGRQVVMNNRCGANQSDFVTPEYATFGAPLSQKWESSAGMDPYSYGYNSDTPPDAYQNASSIIAELVDIVSKGGNFLIDIGPMQDGTVIPEEREPLLEVGTWLNHSGAAIYNTRPWFIQPADTTAGLTDVRFTTTADAFYIIAISRPTGSLKTAAPIPITGGDHVVLLGGPGNPLSWSVADAGVLSVDVSDAELDMVNLPTWAFEITYGLHLYERGNSILQYKVLQQSTSVKLVPQLKRLLVTIPNRLDPWNTVTLDPLAMSHRTPSSSTHVGFPTVAEEDEYEEKQSETSWVMPQIPLRAVNPTVISSNGSPRGPILSPLPTAAMDPRMSAHVQQWTTMIEHGPPPDFVDAQPTGIETMSIGRYTSATLETFPYDRAPNLQKLTRVYYRLYTRTGGAYPSRHPEHADDPSLSHIYSEHVPPPRLAEHFLLHVCAREGIHPSRVQLFVQSESGPELRPAVHDEVLKPLPPESEKETLHFNIDMPKDAAREVAAEPVGVLTSGGRAVGLRGSHVGPAVIQVTMMPRPIASVIVYSALASGAAIVEIDRDIPLA
ncbi:hypothetical protein NM688_g3482 [Phlebia brevispora]|uniref:Uncharacterized protein n=1 Tax=Phlebia brevispora TaxID=194682 RepID=A0ACC1T5T9_9APHY|nr:hypothetical protein NM688_g3482 [Phlebia brevispora]